MAGAGDPRAVAGEAAGPLSFSVDGRGAVRQRLSIGEIAELLRSGEGQFWVDIDSRREDQWLLLTELFRFHPLAVEDTRSPACRIKVEEYDGYLFIVLRGIRFATWTPDPYDLESINLYAFLGPNYVVTVHAEPLRSVQTVAERLAGGPDVLARGAEYLTYQLADTLVDLYFPLLDEVGGFIDELEEEIFHGGGEQDIMERILDLKRMLLSLRRELAAMREVAGSLASRPSPYLRLETQVYMRDVFDHLVRQLDSVETYRDLVSGAIDLRLSVLGNRTNQVMKSLSIVATLVLPATLVASIYGMNFEWMPGLENPFGFWWALIGMGMVAGGFYLWLWWKGWL